MAKSDRQRGSGAARVRAQTAGRIRVWQAARLLLLALLPLATFWQVRGNQFVSYDDPEYVTSNEVVRQGLTRAGAAWAVITGHGANWFPLTWLSHMADVSLFGLAPSGHHTTNLLLHVANTLLVFLLLRGLTGEEWRSAWVAALFAVHPAHVESVAWIAERKDLLSAAFGLATMLAYVFWVRRRGRGRYAAVLLLFAAGLMSKPMLVSLPLVLLLLDYWPLERFRGEGNPAARLVLEKAPLLLMAAASSVVTFLVQRAGGAVRTFENFPFWTRVGNALVAYVRYLWMLVWPARLAVFYPHPGTSLSVATIFTCGLVLAVLSVAAVVLRRKAPFFFVGWFWFLITLLPVIGLVQVGLQAMADRYTYVPFLGLFVAVAWGAPAVISGRRFARFALPAAAVGLLLALAVAAAAQVRVWKDSETLYLHALRVTKDNSVAQNNLGDYYNEMGRPAEAMPHLLEALRLNPKSSEVHVNLGRSLFLVARYDEAEQHFLQSLRLEPDKAIALNNLARTRFVQGDIREAIRFYRATIARSPNAADARKRLAIALLMEGETAAARDQLERATILAPSETGYRRLLEGIPSPAWSGDESFGEELRGVLSAAHREVGAGLQRRGKNAEALAHFQRAVELVPASSEAHTDLGALLANGGRLDEAEAEFRLALRIDPGSALTHTDLGYILFLKGQKEAAIAEHVEALRLQPGLPLARNNLELALHGQGERPKH